MIEAYEIGIKLALQDGVSDGIAVIRRDLGSLDQAIAQTALRLGALARIGAQALAASQGQVEQAVYGPPPRRPAAVTVPPPAPPSERVAAPQPPSGEPEAVAAPLPIVAPPIGPASALPSAARTAAEGTGPASLPVSPRPAVSAAPAAIRPAAPVVESAPAVVEPRRHEPLPVAPAPRAVAPGAPAGGAPAARKAAPAPREAGFVAPTGERPAGRVLLPAIAPSIVPQPGEKQGSVAPLAPAEPRARAARLADAPSREAREGRPGRPGVTQGMPATRMSPAPAGAALAPPASPAVAGQAPSYAPPAASAQAKEGLMRGDVFLDGVRVGRWMSEQMARDAGRPNTGPTGFDPRRSAAWPGAAVTW